MKDLVIKENIFKSNVLNIYNAQDTNQNLLLYKINSSKIEKIAKSFSYILKTYSTKKISGVNPILSYWEEDGDLNIVELLGDGKPLSTISITELDESKILNYILQISEVLCAITNLKVHHNNLTPEHIYISDGFVSIGQIFLPHFNSQNIYSKFLKARGVQEFSEKYDVMLLALVILDLLTGYKLNLNLSDPLYNIDEAFSNINGDYDRLIYLLKTMLQQDNGFDSFLQVVRFIEDSELSLSIEGTPDLQTVETESSLPNEESKATDYSIDHSFNEQSEGIEEGQDYNARKESIFYAFENQHQEVSETSHPEDGDSGITPQSESDSLYYAQPVDNSQHVIPSNNFQTAYTNNSGVNQAESIGSIYDKKENMFGAHENSVSGAIDPQNKAKKFKPIYAVLPAVLLVLFGLYWFFFIFNTAENKLYRYVNNGSYQEAFDYYNANKANFNNSASALLKSVVYGMYYYDKNIYLRSNYYLEPVNVNEIRNSTTKAKITTTKEYLVKKLEVIKKRFILLLDSYTKSQTSNDLGAFLNLFDDQINYYGVVTNKSDLETKMKQYFKNTQTAFDKIKIESFGSTEKDEIELRVQEFQSARNNNAPYNTYGYSKTLLLTEKANEYKIKSIINNEELISKKTNTVKVDGFTVTIANKNNSYRVTVVRPDGTDADIDYFEKTKGIKYKMFVDDYDDDETLEVLLFLTDKDKANYGSLRIYKLNTMSKTSIDLNAPFFSFDYYGSDNIRRFLIGNNYFANAFNEDENATKMPPIIYRYSNNSFNEETILAIEFLHSHSLTAEKNVQKYRQENNVNCGSDLSNYKSVLAVYLVDKILSEGGNAGINAIKRYFNCPDEQQDFWNQIVNLMSTYKGVDMDNLRSLKVSPQYSN